MSSDAKIIGYCRACGKALDETTARNAQGTIFCEEHVPAPPVPPPPATYTAPAYHAGGSPYASPYATQPPPMPNRSPAGQGGSPGLAFALGLIPGVGAVYNGQYAKGLIHVVIVGILISIMDSGSARGLEPLFGLLTACFWFYMAFEAYHTARKRRMGQPLDEFSSIMPTGAWSLDAQRGRSRFPIGPVVLIGLGVLFLLDNLDLLDMRKAMRYWPAILIVYGAYLLFARVGGGRPPNPPGPGAPLNPSDPLAPLSTDAGFKPAEPRVP